MRRLAPAFVLLAAAISGPGLCASPERPSPQVVSTTSEVRITAVELRPVVRDASGRYVGDLSENDFRVIDDGQPAEIREFRIEDQPLHIALVVDTSHSMEYRTETISKACLRLLENLAAFDRISLVVYNHEIRVLSSGERASGVIRESLSRLEASGGTALFDALLAGLEDLSRSSGRRAVMILSDGQDRSSVAGLEEVLSRSRDLGLPIFPVSLAADRADADQRAVLSRLAQGSGGRAQVIRSPAGIDGAFRRITKQLRPGYVLTFHPRPGPAGKRSVQVRLADPGLHAICRESYDHH